MLELTWLIPALPLAGFVLILLFGRRLGEPLAGWLATLMCGAACSTVIRPGQTGTWIGFHLARVAGY